MVLAARAAASWVLADLKASFYFPALLHLIFIELIMLPLFQFALYSFLRESMVEMARHSYGGECESCAMGLSPQSRKAFYTEFMWSPKNLGSLTAEYGTAGHIGVHPAALVPVVIHYFNLVIVAGLWFSTVIMFCMKIPLSTPIGSGRYLKFLWQTHTSRWYQRVCKVLEVGAPISILICLCAAFSFRGLPAVRWVIEEQLVDGITVVVSMRQFTRPARPRFNFEVEDFEHILFKLRIMHNSNAIVNELHGEFCQAFASTRVKVLDGHEHVNLSMLKFAKETDCDDIVNLIGRSNNETD